MCWFRSCLILLLLRRVRCFSSFIHLGGIFLLGLRLCWSCLLSKYLLHHKILSNFSMSYWIKMLLSLTARNIAWNVYFWFRLLFFTLTFITCLNSFQGSHFLNFLLLLLNSLSSLILLKLSFKFFSWRGSLSPTSLWKLDLSVGWLSVLLLEFLILGNTLWFRPYYLLEY